MDETIKGEVVTGDRLVVDPKTVGLDPTRGGS